jgi:uncharacterized protein
MRRHDGDDPDHGSRGAMLVAELRCAGLLELEDDRARLLELACRTHTDGTTSSDPTVGVCFDADRLDLGAWGSGSIRDFFPLSPGVGKPSSRERRILPG